MVFGSGVLIVNASGDFSLEVAKRAFQEMLIAVVECQANKILFDGRTMKGKPEVLERFFYGEFAARETQKLIQKHKFVPRLAYVLNTPLRDPNRFGETVAINRGMHCKVFGSLHEAIKWLNPS